MIEKKLHKYILSNVLSMMGISCYILADTFFIARAAGADGITALNLTLPVYGIIYACGSMIGIGSATRYALLKATGSREAGVFFSESVIWTLLFSLVFVALGVFCPDTVLKMMGADAQIIRVGQTYMRIALCFAPCFMVNYSFTAFVRNDGAPKIAMAATILSSLFNILFDYILVFPLGMGMTGAALATGVSPVVSMSVCMLHYLSKKNTITFQPCVPSPGRLLASCKLGMFAFVEEIASGITTLVFNFILLEQAGNLAVAAYGVVANIALVGTGIFNGVAHGLQPLAGEAGGKGDTVSGNKIYRRSLLIGIGIAVALVAAIWIFAEPCAQAFNSDHSEQLMAYAVPGLRIYFTGFFVAAVNIIRAGFLSATGCGRESFVIAVLRGVVAIVGFAFLLSKLFGITGVWCAFPAAEAFTLLITCRLGKGQVKGRITADFT